MKGFKSIAGVVLVSFLVYGFVNAIEMPFSYRNACDKAGGVEVYMKSGRMCIKKDAIVNIGG